jgi:hypothetical protein
MLAAVAARHLAQQRLELVEQVAQVVVVTEAQGHLSQFQVEQAQLIAVAVAAAVLVAMDLAAMVALE